jgi:hypothetical protein
VATGYADVFYVDIGPTFQTPAEEEQAVENDT